MNNSIGSLEPAFQDHEIDLDRARGARQLLLDRLKQGQKEGHWLGELSTSALSTATAVSALCQAYKHSAHIVELAAKREIWRERIHAGIEWLAAAQNADGGFGDTNRSHSNIATSFLVLAAQRMVNDVVNSPKRQQPTGSGRGMDASYAGWGLSVEQQEAARKYVDHLGSWDGLRARYGKDKTFVVPIMTNCALADMVEWKEIPPLPFEAAALPQSWYRFARMPVVSYAIPALVAIGQCRFHHCPPKNPLTRRLRSSVMHRTTQVLAKMQPDSGGYLEAIPLTSFVAMSMIAIGQLKLPVTQRCLQFIEDAVLPDGSWPIDTNLATWVTSLTVRVLAASDEESKDVEAVRSLVTPRTIQWLLDCQHKSRHPFTGAEPGGWGWTDLSGAVPDADDTPAAIIALDRWSRNHPQSLDSRLHQAIETAIESGGEWLLNLQNRDGGWPTFCRGWGQLPFDRSGADLTAHALRALLCVRAREVTSKARSQKLQRIDRATERGLRYLTSTQRIDGSWLPLWFGNQDEKGEENPIYGTSRVLLCLAELRHSTWSRQSEQLAQPALAFLTKCQNRDGGWGGGASVNYPENIRKLAGLTDPGATLFKPQSPPPFALEPGSSTIEETALALEALLACDTQSRPLESIMAGVRWLSYAVEAGWINVSWPIGFYFAKLWYHERSYPIIYGLAALSALLDRRGRGTVP